MRRSLLFALSVLVLCLGCATNYGVIVPRSQVHVSSIPEGKQFYVLSEHDAKELFGPDLADAPCCKDQNIEAKLSALPVLYTEDMFAFPDGTHAFVAKCGGFYRARIKSVFSSPTPLEIKLDCR